MEEKVDYLTPLSFRENCSAELLASLLWVILLILPAVVVMVCFWSPEFKKNEEIQKKLLG